MPGLKDTQKIDTHIPTALRQGRALLQFEASAKAALVIAHPGHELRVHGWLEFARPAVFVLTDGSGRAAASRLEATRRILAVALARPGSIYGWLADREFYSALLQRQVEKFVRLSEELAHALMANRVDYVVGDKVEGYNPAHDICRCVIDAAVALVEGRGRRIANFEFCLMNEIGEINPDAVTLQLDDEALARKLQAARSYTELSGEVDAALMKREARQFGTERFSAIAQPFAHVEPPQLPTFYESYGEQQVTAGYYDRVIRYRDHVLPVIEALKEHVKCKSAGVSGREQEKS